MSDVKNLGGKASIKLQFPVCFENSSNCFSTRFIPPGLLCVITKLGIIPASYDAMANLKSDT